MSALTTEQGAGEGFAYEKFLEPLYDADLKRLPVVDPERTYYRLREVWKLGTLYADELSVDAICQAMGKLSRESKDDVLRFARGSRKSLKPGTALEAEITIKRAMLDEIAQENKGYGVDGEFQDVEPAPLDPDQPWQLRAECQDINPDVFFSPDNARGPRKRAAERLAQQICWRCSVIDECRGAGIGRPEQYGVWGGTTEGQRDAIRAKS